MQQAAVSHVPKTQTSEQSEVMMKNKTKLSVAVIMLGLMAFATQLRATTIFSDDFNSENGGAGFLNYGTPNQNGDGGAGSINTSFANWLVTAGGVDLIPLASPSPTYGTTFDLTPGSGHGLYVDMEGTNSGIGTLTLRNAISLGAGSYTLFYDMAGNQRTTASDTVIISVNSGVLATDTKTLAETSPWTTYSLAFTLVSPTSVTFAFQDGGDFDNIGNLLDNVRLDGPGASGVPDGGMTALLLGLGLAGLALFGIHHNRRQVCLQVAK